MKPLDQLTDLELLQQARRAVEALPDAPAGLQRSVIALWSSAARSVPLAETARSALRQLAALLTFDSWAGPALAHGMRSMPSSTRHLLFSVVGRDIDLRISPAADLYLLAGQILGPDEAGAVAIRGQGNPLGDARSVSLDSLGEFRIDGVRPGRYELTLRLGEDEIVLPPIEVGS